MAAGMTPNENAPEEVREAESHAGLGEPQGGWAQLWTSEDWWAVWVGGAILAIAFLAVMTVEPQTNAEGEISVKSPLAGWLGKPGGWQGNPLAAVVTFGEEGQITATKFPGILSAFVGLGVLFGGAMALRGQSLPRFVLAFPVVFLLALLAYLLAGQSVINALNLEYALWALLVGLLISNTIGTPAWLKPAVLTEFYIKTGLVLLGAEVLLSRLLALGVPGICVAWVVTPIVLVSTYIFGQKVLKIGSPSLNMVISADMSVCGVSAAIATAGACRAKKEELSLAIGLSLSFTVIMMIVLPAVIKLMGLDPLVGGAWLGGTIDATGAVAAAGEALGDEAAKVAVTVKMIQNILIGVTAFGVALYWVSFVERDPRGQRLGVGEIWRRFPKFVIGFVLASLVFSAIFRTGDYGEALVNAMIGDSTKSLRGWLFCLAFVSIGLETNFRELLPYFRSGKPLVLYVCGQTLNLVLTLLMAWLMFGVLADFFQL